jgi:hypothetical protein
MKLPKMRKDEFVEKMWNRKMERIARQQEGVIIGFVTEMRSDVEMIDTGFYEREPRRGRTRTTLTIEVIDTEGCVFYGGKKVEIREVEE